MEKYTTITTRQLSTVKMSILSKLSYGFNTIGIKTPAGVFPPLDTDSDPKMYVGQRGT